MKSISYKNGGAGLNEYHSGILPDNSDVMFFDKTGVSVDRAAGTVRRAVRKV